MAQNHTFDLLQGAIAPIIHRGIRLCSTATAAWYGFTKSQFYRLQSTAPVSERHHTAQQRCPRSSEARCSSWLSRFFKENAQEHPATHRRWLSAGQTKQAVYLQYVEECTFFPVGRTTFYNIWRSTFSDVTIPSWSPFSVCSICAEYKQSRRMLLQPQIRNAVKIEYDIHISRSMLVYHSSSSAEEPYLCSNGPTGMLVERFQTIVPKRHGSPSAT